MLCPPVKLYANAPAMIFIDDHHNTSYAFYGTLPNPIFIVTISADDSPRHILNRNGFVLVNVNVIGEDNHRRNGESVGCIVPFLGPSHHPHHLVYHGYGDHGHLVLCSHDPDQNNGGDLFPYLRHGDHCDNHNVHACSLCRDLQIVLIAKKNNT